MSYVSVCMTFSNKAAKRRQEGEESTDRNIDGSMERTIHRGKTIKDNGDILYQSI